VGALSIGEVDAMVDAAMRQWDVVFLYADPPMFDEQVALWADRHTRRQNRRDGGRVVFPILTRRDTVMAPTLEAFANAIASGEAKRVDDEDMTRHLGNAVKRRIRPGDPDSPWTIRKEHKGSPRKIDMAVAAALAWKAFLDATQKGYAQRASRVLHFY
jgi:hypothetical protein